MSFMIGFNHDLWCPFLTGAGIAVVQFLFAGNGARTPFGVIGTRVRTVRITKMHVKSEWIPW